MNFKRISSGVLLGMSFSAAAGSMVASASQDVASHPNPGPSMSKPRVASGDRLDSLSRQNGQSGWTCPMHPEIHKHESGKCPICKMNLVKAKPKSD